MGNFVRIILDDGTEVVAEQVLGPCVLLVQPKELWTGEEMNGLLHAIHGAQQTLKAHGIDALVANANVKFTVISDPVVVSKP